jgi:hypothetical protein
MTNLIYNNNNHLSRYLYNTNKVCYSTNVKLTCADLLTENFLDWQKGQGQVRKLKDFADYLEIHEVTLNQLINDRKPASEKMLVHLAQKTGDVRFYNVADLPSPDPDLQALTRIWPHLTEEARHALRSQGEKFADENERPSAQSRSMEEIT